MTGVSFPSPNYTPGRSRPITRILIHATRGGTATPEIERQATLNWFTNPTSKASAHAVIAVDGTIYRCVNDGDTAWHAGDKDPALNENPGSLGVELVQARIESPFTQAQYTSLVWLVKGWCEKWLIPKDRSHILGHDETATGKKWGKTDPGYYFDWGIFMSMLQGEIKEDDMNALLADAALKIADWLSLRHQAYIKNTVSDARTHFNKIGDTAAALQANVALFASWCAEGGSGQRDDFEKHLKAIGITQPPERYGYDPRALLMFRMLKG